MAPVDGLGRESSAELVPVLASQASCSQVGRFLRGGMLAFLADVGGMGTGCFDEHFPLEDADVSAAGYLQCSVALRYFALHPRVCVIMCNQRFYFFDLSAMSVRLFLIVRLSRPPTHTAGHVSPLSFFQKQDIDKRLQLNSLIPQ